MANTHHAVNGKHNTDSRENVDRQTDSRQEAGRPINRQIAIIAYSSVLDKQTEIDR